MSTGTEREQPRNFRRIAKSFEANIRAIQTLNEDVGRAAEERDEAAVTAFREEVGELFGLDPETSGRVEKVEISLGESGEENSDAHLGPGDNGAGTEQPGVEIKKRMSYVLEDPQKRIKFYEIVSGFVRKSPTQASLLRRGALTILMGYLEVLFSEIIRTYYQLYPAALPSDTRMLSLNELRSLGSIEEAEAHLISREVESVLREDLDSQLSYFAKRLKLDLAPLEEYLAEVTEISQRRNLIVHNNGIVNKMYLARVEGALVDSCGLKEGLAADVTSAYLGKASECIFLVGTIVLQKCWRKWQRDSMEEADGMMISATYDFLLDERYELTRRLAELAGSLEFANESNRKMVVVNHAIALKELARRDDMEKLLSSHDWSASALKFRLALLALRDDISGVAELLPKAALAGEVDHDHLQRWPLFKGLRAAPQYGAILALCFPGCESGPPSQGALQ